MEEQWKWRGGRCFELGQLSQTISYVPKINESRCNVHAGQVIRGKKIYLVVGKTLPAPSIPTKNLIMNSV